MFDNDRPSPLHTHVEFLQFPSNEHKAVKGQKVPQLEVPVGNYIVVRVSVNFNALFD